MNEDTWVPPSLRAPAGFWLTRDGRLFQIVQMGTDHLHSAIRLFTRCGFGDHSKIRELCRELAQREVIVMSTEIFPTVVLRKDEVLARDLPDFEWHNSSRGDDPRYVRQLHHANLVSRGLVPRGREVPTPDVLQPQNLPKKPPPRRREE